MFNIFKKAPRGSLSKSQQLGAFFLVLIFALLLGGMVLVHFYKPAASSQNKEDNSLLEEKRNYLDSVHKAAASDEKDGREIYPFNPNFISDAKGYRLGLSPAEIDRLHRFRDKGKWINSTSDFKRVTKISDSVLDSISPYFEFPQWVVDKQKEKSEPKEKTASKPAFSSKKDLNAATAKDLKKVKGIGAAFAKRILKERRQHKGFDTIIQIKDVYGIPVETEEKLKASFYVKAQKPQRVNLNTASVAEIAEKRYMTYELAREVVLFRQLHENIESFEELGKIDNFPAYKIERLKVYFTLK